MDVFLGTILPVGFNFAPRGFALCAGQVMSIQTNAALFSLLGTTFGGNGVQTFGLPDLRGRVAIGQGQGPGLSNYVMGEMAGTENVTLTINNLPQHTHAAVFTPSGTSSVAVTVKASTQQASQSIPGTQGATTLAAPYYADGPGAVNGYVADPNPTVTLAGVTVTGTTTGGGTVTNGATGSGFPISILQPFLTVNYIIATAGIFPSRN